MAIVNTKKLNKNGEYGTLTLSLKGLFDAIQKGNVDIPAEQRTVKDRGAKYKHMRDSFLAHVLVHTFFDNCISNETEEMLNKIFDGDVQVVNGTIQFVGISVDANDKIYLSDGQHRFCHYLQEFFAGTARLTAGTDFGGDYLNDCMEQLFNAIELDDGDGKVAKTIITINNFSHEDQERIYAQRVVAQFVKTDDDCERRTLFSAMNKNVQITQADHDKSNYGHTPMFKCAAKVQETLAEIRENEPASIEHCKWYSPADAWALKVLFNANIRTFIPLVAHMGLLTYLPKKLLGEDYVWERNCDQTQADQVRNFFKATQNMNEEECYKFLTNIMDDVVVLSKMMYRGNTNKMECAKGLKSLLVGELHALHTCPQVMPEETFVSIAAEVHSKLVNENKYVPILKSGKPSYDRTHFNNGHRLRSKNELFAKWVLDEFNAQNKEEE